MCAADRTVIQQSAATCRCVAVAGSLAVQGHKSQPIEILVILACVLQYLCGSCGNFRPLKLALNRDFRNGRPYQVGTVLLWVSNENVNGCVAA